MLWFRMMVVSSLAVFLASLSVVDFSPSAAPWAASVLAVSLFAAPSIAAFLRWAGRKRGVLALAAVGAAAIAVEAASVLTGFPYGRFSYSGALGPMILGLVPFALPLSYLPLLIGALSVAMRASGNSRLRALLVSASLLVAFDLALDPGAVAAGLWSWEEPGAYYGVPAENYFGWALTGLAHSAAMLALVGKGIRCRGVPPGASASAVITLSFWSGYLFKAGHALPGAIGAALIALLCAAEWAWARGRGLLKTGAP